MKNSIERYIGLMCGTSIDGVDVALVEFDGQSNNLIAAYLHPIDKDLKNKLRSLCSLNSRECYLENFAHRVELLGELDTRMGHVFADSVNALLAKHQINPKTIRAIGSHGQTIRHQPAQASPFSLQIGDANIIAHQTGITTIADFRRMDIAAGGQGAPLAPAFHNAAMRSQDENRIILNLGGIANITLLPKDKLAPVLGFDTGTANTLLDVWYMQQHPDPNQDYDKDAVFAQQGEVDEKLLAHLCDDPYFDLPPPKSTGREYFSIEWLWNKIKDLELEIKPADVQRTLLEFTAKTVSQAIFALQLEDFNVYTCGGGSHNKLLIERLEALLNCPVKTTDTIGVDGDYLEAITFAWLARQRLHQLPGNLPSVTGAKTQKVLGVLIHP